MNKTDQDHVWKVVNRAKSCLLGKIEADINSRLPEKPSELSDWEKYKLIKSGEAKLIKTFTVKQMMSNYSSDRPRLIEAFTYPERPEVIAYEKAKKAVQEEKDTRELAVETAFNRLADERIMGILDTKDFLDSVERMQQDKW